ncbi:MAG: HD domain-containing protein [bacterium]|nr:HD domain-containing protein [bacterium]MDZ4231679.1 HD domain-containing protein [Candidatus Pacearchaeota archaeon]
MKRTLAFLQKVGELKHLQRQGVLLYGYKNADSASDHTLRLAIMVWVFGQGRRMNLEQALKIALVHDLCKVYTGDITPYDGLFSNGKAASAKEKYDVAKRWRRLTIKQKEKRFKDRFRKEYAALKKLIGKLPERVRRDMERAWCDYQKLESPEAKFVNQVDRAENLLEAFEAWEIDKRFPTMPWWEHADEVIHDKTLQEFLREIEKEELRRKK